MSERRRGLLPPQNPGLLTAFAMRRGLYFVNALMAVVFGLGLLVLVLYPEVVSAGLNRRVEQIVLNRAVAGHPELRAPLDREETVMPLVRTLIEESKPAQQLRRTAVARYAEDRYANLVSELRRDLLIFCTTNLVLFILAAVAIRRQPAGRSAPVFSTILMASAAIGTWCYYSQNWLETLLFSSYFGYGYITLVGVIGAALCDVAFNYGRILRMIVDALAAAVSHP
jgi:hypothetical protein